MITGKPLWESSNSESNFENPKLSTQAKDFLNNCLVKNPSSFLKIVDIVQPPEFTRKRPCYHCMYFLRLRENKALRRLTQVRDMVTEFGVDSESENSELGTDSEGGNSELDANSKGGNSELDADFKGGNSSQNC